MSRYVVFSGFLGAGKTTGMLAFAEYFTAKGLRPAILVNDLGTRDLVDGIYTDASGFCCDEITGDCICYQTDALLGKLRGFRDSSGAEIILSDIPGCGIGALDHVYHTLARTHPDEFTLCPFTAVADPERLRCIMPEQADLHLPEELRFLFDAQLREAELILLNKIDTLSPGQRETYRAFLTERYPNAKVILISARTGEGIGEAAEYLLSAESSLPEPDVGYGSPAFFAAERQLCWYDRRFSVRSVEPADGNAFLSDFFETVRRELRAAGRNVPHLKAFAAGDGQHAKVSLLGVDYVPEFDCRFSAPQRELRVAVNARAACESGVLDFLMDAALKEACERHGLALRVLFTECFGMTRD